MKKKKFTTSYIRAWHMLICTTNAKCKKKVEFTYPYRYIMYPQSKGNAKKDTKKVCNALCA